MPSFRITSFPPTAQNRSGETLDCWLIRLECEDGQRFALALRGLDPACSLGSLSGRKASAIVTDLLRPGWEDVARLRGEPVVMDDRVYRNFLLRRVSRIDGGRPWEVECFVESSLDSDASWDRVILALNDLHRAVTPASKSNDG